MSELNLSSVVELTELIQLGAVSPVEIAEAYLQQIEKLNPALNAVVTLAPDLLERARAADAIPPDQRGPLHGIPFTVKDTIATAGLRSTSGSAMRRDFVPTEDAPVVARLKAAGALLLGKTNTAEMAMDYSADNPVFGRTNNPYDSARTPGGSSGGEAVAIATGMSPCGLGSDLAGSIRIPAHFCGIAGFKPSTGRVPGAGQFPASTGPYSLGSVIGPMARRVEDLYLLFTVLTETGDGSIDVLRRRQSELQGLRVALYPNDGVVPVNEDTRRVVAAAAGALAQFGLQLDEQRPPAVERAPELWLKIFSRASVVELRELYAGHEAEAGSFVRWRMATADDTPPPTLDEYIRSWRERDSLRAELLEWMEQTPLLLAPVGAVTAFPHDAHKVTIGERRVSTFRAFSYSQAFNVFDLPAVCVPAGQSHEGLPIGVQIVGRPGDETTVLAAARVIEESLAGWRHYP